MSNIFTSNLVKEKLYFKIKFGRDKKEEEEKKRKERWIAAPKLCH